MCVCCARMFVHCVCLVCVGVRGCMFGQTAWAECKWMFSSKFDIDDKLRGNLGQLFREIDQDGSGFLDRAEVEQLSKRLGKLMTERELAASMTAMGADADGQVSLEGFVAWWRKSKAGDGGAGDGEEDSGAFAAVMEQAEYMELLADATEEDARELCEEAGISPVPATLEGMVAALKQQHQRQDKTLIYQRSDGSSSDHTGVEEVHVLVAAGGITDATYVWYEGLETWSQWSSCKVGFDGSFDEHADAHDDDDDDEATAATAVSDVGPGPGGADDAADTAASSDGTSPVRRHDEQNQEKEKEQQQQQKQQQQQHENVSAVSDTDTAGGSLADHTDASEDDQYSGPSRTSSIELLARNSLVSQRLSRFGEPVDEAKTLAPVDLQVPRHLLLPHERSDLSIEHAATVSALGSMETSDVHVNVDESADEQKAVDVIVAKLRAGKTSKAGNAETAQLDKSQHDCTSPIEDGRVDQGEEQSTAAVLPRPSAVSNQDRCCVLETAAGLTTIQTGLFPRIAMLEASVFGASLDEKAQQSLGLARRLEDLEAELM